MEPEAGEEARTFLDLLEDGYRLHFSRSGLVFDFDAPGTEPPEHEMNIEFHRIGIDLIRNLVNHASSAPRPPSTGGSADGGDGGEDDRGNGGGDGETGLETVVGGCLPLSGHKTDGGEDGSGDGGGDGETRLETASPGAPPIPCLDTAAFLVAERARTTSDPGLEPSTGQDFEVARPRDVSAFNGVGESPDRAEAATTGAGIPGEQQVLTDAPFPGS